MLAPSTLDDTREEIIDKSQYSTWDIYQLGFPRGFEQKTRIRM